MGSNLFFDVPPDKYDASVNRGGMPHHNRHAWRFAPVHARPLFHADGKIAYRIVVGIFLLIVFLGGAYYYWAGGMSRKTTPTTIAVGKNDERSIPYRYKIEKPDQPGVSEDFVLQSEHDAAVQAPPISRPAGGAAGAVQETEDAVSSIQEPPVGHSAAKPSSGKALPLTEEAQEARGPHEVKDDARVVTGPGAHQPTEPPKSTEKTIGAALEPGETSAPPKEEAPSTGKTPGRRFFVQTAAVNVRDQPSLKGNVLFQVQGGEAVRTTEQKGKWRLIQTDDGRSGWVNRAFLSNVPVPQQGDVSHKREIRAIKVEPWSQERARIFFEISPLVIPEILVLEGERPRVVCDFPDVVPAPRLGDRIAVDDEIILGIRIGLHQGPPPKVRVVLDLKPGLRYAAGRSGEEEEVKGGFALEVRIIEAP